MTMIFTDFVFILQRNKNIWLAVIIVVLIVVFFFLKKCRRNFFFLEFNFPSSYHKLSRYLYNEFKSLLILLLICAPTIRLSYPVGAADTVALLGELLLLAPNRLYEYFGFGVDVLKYWAKFSKLYGLFVVDANRFR